MTFRRIVKLGLFLCLALAVWPTPQAHAQESKQKSLSLSQGTNMSATVSPDGKTIVIDLLGALWSLPMEGGTATRLTDPSQIEARLPRWSPDGTQIAFQGFTDGYWHIWTLEIESNALKQLTRGENDDREPSWHPSSGAIVFSSDRGGQDDIWQLDLDPLFDFLLIQITDTEEQDRQPTWSPDGSTLAYISGNNWQSALILREGTEGRPLVQKKGTISSPSWHPKGTSLTFTHIDNEQAGLFLAEAESDGVLPLHEPNEDVFPFPATWLDPQTLLYTSDGVIKKLSLSTFSTEIISFTADVQVVQPAYEKKRHDLISTDEKPVKGILGPVLNKDGSKVLFTAIGDLWLQEIGGPLTRLTHSPEVELDPAWSPDGNRIAYVSDREGVMDIYTRDLASGAETKVTSLRTGATAPAWSPEGSKIAFHQSTGNNGLGPMIPGYIDHESGKVSSLSGALWGPGRPSWSADGNWIALNAQAPSKSRTRSKKNKVLLISPETKEKLWLSPRQDLSLGMRQQNGPLWHPETSELLFTMGGEIWRAALDQENGTLKEKQIARAQPESMPSSLSLSGDRNWLSYLVDGKLYRQNLNVPEAAPEKIEINLTYAPDVAKGRKIIHAGRLFNGVDDAHLTNVDILIEGAVIKDIRPHQEHEDDIEVIDASAQTIIPGLFDMHVHQHAGLGTKIGKSWLAYGVTNVREPGANPYDALERKEAWASGARPGPRQFFSGGQLDGPRTVYAFSQPTASLKEIKQELNRARALDYDFIKTYTTLSDTHRKVVIEEAHAMGLGVTAHDFTSAAFFGGDAIEHLRGTSRRGYSQKLSETNKAYEDVIKVAGQTGMKVTPTLVARGGFAKIAKEDPSLFEDPHFLRLHSEADRKMMSGMIMGMAGKMDIVTKRMKEHGKEILSLKNEGAIITTGTDAPIIPYGLSLLVEIELLNEAGLSPQEAIRSASLEAARYLGVDDQLGSIEVGKIADMVILDGDPLNNLKDLRNTKSVLKGGTLYKISELLD